MTNINPTKMSWMGYGVQAILDRNFYLQLLREDLNSDNCSLYILKLFLSGLFKFENSQDDKLSN